MASRYILSADYAIDKSVLRTKLHSSLEWNLAIPSNTIFYIGLGIQTTNCRADIIKESLTNEY